MVCQKKLPFHYNSACFFLWTKMLQGSPMSLGSPVARIQEKMYLAKPLHLLLNTIVRPWGYNMYAYVCMQACIDGSVWMYLYVCHMYVICMSYVCLSVYPSIRISVCLYVCRYVCLYVCMSACLPVCLSVCMYVCMYVSAMYVLCMYIYGLVFLPQNQTLRKSIGFPVNFWMNQFWECSFQRIHWISRSRPGIPSHSHS